MTDSDISNYNQILQGVLFNWREISDDINIMNILDMQKNKTCQMLGDNDSYESDSMIQAKSFALMVWLLTKIENY